MQRRTLVSSASVGVLTALIATQGTVAAVAEEAESPSVALVGQMVFVSGDESGPDAEALKEVRDTAVAPVAVEIPESLTDEEEVEFIASKAGELANDEDPGESGSITPLATDTATGTCGWSSVTLQDAFGTYVGYYQARFGLNRPGTSYTMNEHVWDPSFWDFSSWTWTETGNLGGGTSWSDDFTFTVDDQTTYSAELDGEVYMGNGWCITAGAQVNNVHIQ